MLKRMSMKKIVTSSIVLLIVFLVYLIPKQSNSPSPIKTTVEYVNQNIKTHTIYLLDNNNYISKTSVKVKFDSGESLARELLETMIEEGKNSDQIPNGFRPIIPSGTQINALKLNENTLKLDLSKEFLQISKELEEPLIEAVVYTLTSMEEIDNIILYVDGKLLTKLPQSNIQLPDTLNRNIGINKNYQLTSTKDITATTVYYIHKYNDEYFYTPITTISNDSREKIEIIIDQLESSNIQKNLMSFLNSSTNLLDYGIQDRQMVVCFDEWIFNDFEAKDILEEVLYTISLSIYDNYDVEEVLFEVNGEEITKTQLKSLE